MSDSKEIFLASPRGFCAGVNRAIDIVELALEVYPPPIYVKHEIVHNKFVVESLSKKGVLFVEELSEIPNEQVVIFSAHGVSPKAWQEAEEKSLEIIDATCPLVTKVHLEAKKYSRENYQIILIGHLDHVETIGTHGEAPNQTTVVESVEDVEALCYSPEQKLAYLTQTTLSMMDTKEIIAALESKFPWIASPKKSDICYATTNRQLAVQKLTQKVQMLLVIGSSNSSNSNRLRELGEKAGLPAYMIENADSLNPHWFHDGITKLGLTSGASVPDILIKDTMEKLSIEFGFQKVTELEITKENVSFQIPKKLKEKVAASV